MNYGKQQIEKLGETNSLLLVNTIATLVTGAASVILALIALFK